MHFEYLQALESACGLLREGGWETAAKSALKKAKRMSRDRDGVATRESVHYIGEWSLCATAHYIQVSP